MKIRNFPNFRQTYEYDCGAQSLGAVLAYYGIDVREEEVMKLAGTAEHGTFARSIKAAAEHHGLAVDFKAMTVEEIQRYLDKKIPVILLLQAWTEKEGIDWRNTWDEGHYAVAIGYDKKRMYFEDPSSIFRTYLTYDELAERWHDQDDKQKYVNYGLAIYGKEPNYHPEKVIHMD